MNNTITTSINGNEKTFVFNRQEEQVEKNSDFVYFFIDGKVKAIKNAIVFINCLSIFEDFNLPITTDDNSIILHNFTENFADILVNAVNEILNEYDDDIDSITARDYRNAIRACDFFEELFERVKNGENIFFAI